VTSNPSLVTHTRPPAFEYPVGLRLAAVIAMFAVAGCSGSSNVATHNSPSPSAAASESPSPGASPSPSPSPAPSPSPTPLPTASPVVVPSWAAMHATCSGSPAAQEALLNLQGGTHVVLADVTDPVHPKTICTLSGSWTPQLVTQGQISWSATQSGSSLIATLDLFTGTSAVVASWTGGAFLDGLHAWSPDHTTLAYVTSDASTVNVHVLSGGGDRVLASFGPVPGRGVNPNEDDEFIGFSPDGGYFALEQTFTSTGNHLVVWNAAGVVFSQASATMATWGTIGSKLYFRQPNASIVYVWDSAGAAGNRSQAFGQQFAWQGPKADAGDDYLAYTVRDASAVPHVYLYGHAGRAGGELPNVRSTPTFINSATVFLIEEAPCGSACGIGPAIQPDKKTFTYSMSSQTETASTIASVLGVWPRLGQV
jgi:hypothetical protein